MRRSAEDENDEMDDYERKRGVAGRRRTGNGLLAQDQHPQRAEAVRLQLLAPLQLIR